MLCEGQKVHSACDRAYSEQSFLYRIQTLIWNLNLWDLKLFRKAFSMNKITIYAVPFLRVNKLSVHLS